MDGTNEARELVGGVPILGYIVSLRVPDSYVPAADYDEFLTSLETDKVLTDGEIRLFVGKRSRWLSECYQVALQRFAQGADDSKQTVRHMLRCDKGSKRTANTARYLVREEVVGDGAARRLFHKDLAVVRLDDATERPVWSMLPSAVEHEEEVRQQVADINSLIEFEENHIPARLIRDGLVRLLDNHTPITYGANPGFLFLPAAAKGTLEALRRALSLINAHAPCHPAAMSVLKLPDLADMRQAIYDAWEVELEETVRNARLIVERYRREHGTDSSRNAARALNDALLSLRRASEKAEKYEKMQLALVDVARSTMDDVQAEARNLLAVDLLEFKPTRQRFEKHTWGAGARMLFEALSATAKDSVPFASLGEVVSWQCGYGLSGVQMLSQEALSDESTFTVAFLRDPGDAFLATNGLSVKKGACGYRATGPATPEGVAQIVAWWNTVAPTVSSK